MDSRFFPHNMHLESVELFSSNDPHLRCLQTQPLVHTSSLIQELPRIEPGIYTIGGGRQVGKSTMLKQWMLTLLHEGVNPQHIAFLTGELIDDHHVVVRLVQDILSHKSSESPFYLILDEVTYIREWDKAIKFLADAGFMEGVILVVTGSDLILIREARTRFPGRRGKADKVDFHLRPLSYSETLRLKKTLTNTQIEKIIISETNPSQETLQILYKEFKNFLIHGGYLTAINDMAMEKRILPATFSIYSDWIRGHIVKRGKKEHFLHEILGAIIKQYGSQTTWHSLSSQLSIDHHRTIADYAETLVSMDAVFIQQAILENKLTAAPKKARKVIFTDPFIFHAVRSWLQQVQDPFKDQVLPTIRDPHWAGKLVEAVVTANYSRRYPTFYIKAEGEVDIAYIDDKRFYPIEVKWTGQLRPKDLKQIQKYPNSRIVAKTQHAYNIGHTTVEPLPLALLRLDNETSLPRKLSGQSSKHLK